LGSFGTPDCTNGARISGVNETASVGERLQALVDLCGQARDRFRELEGVEWKANFSVWGFLLASAYLLLTIEPQRAIHLGPWSLVLCLVPPLHFAAIYKLNRSAFFWRTWADYYRDQAKQLMKIPSGQVAAPTGKEPLTKDYWEWIGLEWFPTLIASSIVMLLAW
jgi:hypothetical protein